MAEIACDDFEHLRKELVEYDPSLGEKPFLVAGNKIDEESADQYIKEFKKRFPDIELIPISVSEENINILRHEFLQILFG